MKLCTRCILPETFPGITFDGEGVCSYCHREEATVAKAPEKKVHYRERLDTLIDDTRGRAPVYDAIMAYSGGKDSTYTLQLLKEQYGIRLLAMTLDNHFVSPAAWDNIRKVTDTLGVDHIQFKPSWPVAQKLFSRAAKDDIFPRPTLLRASTICTACITLVKSLVLKTALEMSIPLVAFGWSPGQAPIQSAIMKNNPALIRQNQSSLKKSLPPEIMTDLERYFIPESYYGTYKDHFPTNIHPLAFFDYDENEIMIHLKKLGWQLPTDTDTNSTNCLLNAFANQCHLEHHKFHPYVWEMANMVRQGVLSRDEGIDKIYTEQDKNMVSFAKGRLDV